MLPMITAAAMLIAYASAVPVNIAAEIDLCGGGIAVKTGIAAFASPVPRPKKRQKRAKRMSTRTILTLIRRLRAHIRIRSIRAEGTICARDAMMTALICGSAEIIDSALRAAGMRSVRLCVHPDFSEGATNVRVRGIISVRAGQVIAAAALCAAESIEGRFFKWKDR